MTAEIKDDVSRIKTDRLVPYPNNPKKHPDEQIDKIAGSIQEYGFIQPLVIDEDYQVIIGHGRLLAAKKLDLDEVPVIRSGDLSDPQKKALRIADNRIAESDWDDELLSIELEDLGVDEYDLDPLGFDDEEIMELIEEEDKLDKDKDKYSQKIEAPVYEPTQDNPPPLDKLYNNKKTKKLKEKIDNSNIDKEIKKFLRITANRHTIFNYENIAEYYAHQDKEVQELMEELTLVIIDFDKAIEQGYITFAKDTLEGVGKDEG